VQRYLISPFLVLCTLSLVSTALVLALALSQPWLGVTLAPDGGAVRVAAVDSAGPGQGLRPGDRVIGLGEGGTRIALAPLDLIEEPDGIPTTDGMRDLFARIGTVDALLREGAVTVTVERDGAPVGVTLTPTEARPVSDLPFVFWLQIVTGVAAVLLGGWVLSIRRKEPAAAYLALSALGLMISAHAAALYSTRELALPEAVFAWASSINSLGALVFGIGMVCLFLVYPARYLPRWAPAVVIVVFGTWALLSFFRIPDATGLVIHIPTLTLMLCILLAAIGQIIATRGRPSERAALRWFGLSVVTGAGSFVSLIALPQALGFQPQLSQGYAFALFLIIYVGLVLGVARYRLFDLEFWAFRALFYAGGVALLLLFDALLVYTVAMDRIPAFSIALLLVAFVYLPARDFLARKLTGRSLVSTADLFDLVSGVALAPVGDVQRQKFSELLDELFHPIRIAEAPGPVAEPALRQGGEAMDVPGIEGTADLRMHWPHRGRRLFSPRDVQRVAAVLAMAAQFVERRRAYEAGAEQERQRINRDMHDNIGAQLLGALHSQDGGRKDALIRQTLTDLREIVSNPGGDPVELKTLLGDLRAEIAEHLDSAGIALEWEEGDLPDRAVTPLVVNSVRAILREGVSNILHHSGADRAGVRVAMGMGPRADRLVLTITDNGRGLAPVQPTPASLRTKGNGLRNLRARTEARGGAFSIRTRDGGTGTELRAELPLNSDQDLPVQLRDAGE